MMVGVIAQAVGNGVGIFVDLLAKNYIFSFKNMGFFGGVVSRQHICSSQKTARPPKAAMGYRFELQFGFGAALEK